MSDFDLRVLMLQESPCIRNLKTSRAIRSNSGVQTVDLAYIDDPVNEHLKSMMSECYDNLFQIKSIEGVWNLVKSRSYHLIHSHNEPDWPTEAALFTKLPVIYDCHDLTSLRGMLSDNDSRSELIANKLSSARIYVSDAMLRKAQQKYLNRPDRNLVVHNYPSQSVLDSAASLPKLSAKTGQVHAVYAGGITMGPNTEWHHRSVVPELVNLAMSGVKVHVYLPQAAPEQVRSYLSGITTELVIETPVAPDEIITTLSQYDVGLVLFNQTEDNREHLETSLPNKLFEYLAAGLRVMAPNLEAIRDFRDKFNEAEITIFDDSPEMIKGVSQNKGPISGEYRQPSFEDQVHAIVNLYQHVLVNG